LSLTVLDCHGIIPAKYHFLVLPRLPLVLPTNTSPPDKIDFFPIDLVSLSSLLRLNRHKKSPETASPPMMVLEKLKEAAEDCVAMIKDEMLKTEGFIWDIWVGFHAVPSMK
jgi:aprataxin